MLCCAVMAQPAKQISVVVPLCPFDQEAALKIEDLAARPHPPQLRIRITRTLFYIVLH